MGFHVITVSVLTGLWLVVTALFTAFAHKMFRVEKKNRGLVRLCIILTGLVTWMLSTVQSANDYFPLLISQFQIRHGNFGRPVRRDQHILGTGRHSSPNFHPQETQQRSYPAFSGAYSCYVLVVLGLHVFGSNQPTYRT